MGEHDEALEALEEEALLAEIEAQPQQEGGPMDTRTEEFLASQAVEEYRPRVPGWLRDAVYYAGLLAAMAIMVFPEYPVLVRIGAAVTLAGNALAKVYRRRTR